MSKLQAGIVAAVFLLIVVTAFMFRFTVVAGAVGGEGVHGVVYRLDR
jgi:hypothetical protein